MNDRQLTDLIRRAFQLDHPLAPDRFDEIQRRVVRAEQRAARFRRLGRRLVGWVVGWPDGRQGGGGR